jgi:lysyl-tRNA synthetase class 2
MAQQHSDGAGGAGGVGFGAEVHPLEQQRRANRDAAARLGVDPYGQRVDGLLSLGEARARYDEGADATHNALVAQAKEAGKGTAGAGAGAGAVAGAGPVADARPEVFVAGRIVLLRDNGKLLWLTLRDASGDLQAAVSAKDVPEAEFSLAKSLDLGDIVTVRGRLMKTRTGEVTVWAGALGLACKSLAQPPEKHAGLADVELRYRQRYVDLWANPQTARVMAARSAIVTRLRGLLDGRGFMEVETPMLQSLAGGAAARPFRTHMNALDIDLFMRVSPELYLKRLLVGGLSRVYEINRNFRNEGLSPRHNPEFTMLELYQAFGDYAAMLELTEGLVRELAQLAAGLGLGNVVDPDAGHVGAVGPVLRWGERAIDFGRPFDRRAYAELFELGVGCAMSDEAGVREAARRHRSLIGKLDPDRADRWLLVGALFDELGEGVIDKDRPTFVMDYPAALCPLTRSKRGQPEIAERFELFVGGIELANAYTELNDPDVQAAKFREQLSGLEAEESTFRTFDHDFVNALKVGMPPAGGLGVGIDRLVMVLTGQTSIRDVLLFPMMRPSAGEA